MRFFFDRCFPKRLTEALVVIDGHKYVMEHHSAHFAQDSPDVEWLHAVGAWNPKPIVVSGDAKILSRRDEVQELMAQNLYFVTMFGGWTDQDVYEQTWKFFKVWPLIVREVRKCKGPTVFKIVPTANNLENLGLTQRFLK